MPSKPLNLGELFAALFPPRYQRRLVVMMQSFLDASEDGAGRCVTVAGFIGSVPGWCSFQERMQGIRARLGVPYVHMTDLMAKEPPPPYNQIKPHERTALMGEIGELLGKCLMFGVSSSLNLRDFYALPDGDIALFDSNPRGHCLGQCMALVAKLLEEKWQIDESVLYVIETGGRGEGPLVETMLNLFKEDERVRDVLRVLTVVPGTKNQFPAFDAADIYAWLANQHALKYTGTSQERSPYLGKIQLDLESNYLFGDALLAIRDELREVKPGSLTLFGKLAARRKGRP